MTASVKSLRSLYFVQPGGGKMSSDVIEVNVTTADPHLGFVEGSQILAINTFGSIVAVFGVIGNFLSYRSAEHLPEATSKYLMRYLAVLDTLTALLASLFRQALYNVLFHQMRVNIRH